MGRAGLLAGAAALTAAALGVACGKPPDARPNILLVTVDTLRPDRLACYGGPSDVGSALCALADSGARYEWAIASAPSTAPSVTSILTSTYPSTHGVTQLSSSRLPDSAETVAEAFAARGYATAAFVCNPVLERFRNLQQGFEIYDAHMDRRERNRPGVVERDAASATDAALAWLGVSEEPWFLWMHYQDPHGPYDPPDAPPARDAPGDAGTTLTPLSDHSGFAGIPAYQVLPGAYAVATYEERYLDEIRFLDRHLARLLEAVEARSRPTGILLTADHGEAFGEDGYWFAHGHSLALDQIRVPLLWRPPGGSARAVVSLPVSLLDVAPTLLGAAGIPAPPSFAGRPLPLEEPDEGAPERSLFSEHLVRIAVVRGREYYARDHENFVAPVPDMISGGELRPIEARAALLPRDGSMPPYHAVEPQEVAALEDELARFLAAAPAKPEAETGEPSQELREELRALGYLE